MSRLWGALIGTALVALLGYFVVAQTGVSRQVQSLVAGAGTPARSDRAAAPAPAWVAAAPGRVEPRSGEIRLAAAAAGRVVEVLIAVRSAVEDGELLVRLEDDEARARLSAAEMEAIVRRKERDSQPATQGREDVRRAEDAVYAAERAAFGARFALDIARISRRSGTGSEREIQDAKKRLVDARQWVARERTALAQAQSKAGVPAPNRAEAAVAAARIEVAVAESLFERTRLRAPIAGSILQLHAKLGEIVAPGADLPLVVLGDVSALRVKAEVDEADLAKLRAGMPAFVRSASFPGREFMGRVGEIAPTLAPPRIGQRGPRRPTDVEVIEVTIELDAPGSLLPGMRVEAFFKRD